MATIRSLFRLGLPLWIIAITLAAPAAAQKEADQVVAPGPDAPAGKVLEWKSDEDQPYWYRLPVPEADQAKAAEANGASEASAVVEGRGPALILMLHGTGLRWGWAFWNYPGIKTGKWRPNDIVVAPDGMTPDGRGNFNFIQNKENGEQIAGLIKDFRKAYDIDRVYLYGHSQGAFFCYWFAGEYPDLVDGIVPHAGNVLSVRHSKQSRDVAIGIVHGIADAVVTVNCAFRTAQIYRDEDYPMVKLHAVEGLTEQSGHWPLPYQVSQMMDWLDKVTVNDPATAAKIIHAELELEKPDLATVRMLLDRSAKMLKKYKGDDAEDVKNLLDSGWDRFGLIAQAQMRDLEAHTAKLKSKPNFGAWVSQFTAMNEVFYDHDNWKPAMKKAQSLAGKHNKAVAKAISGLGVANPKAFTSGLKALETGFLSPRYEELVIRMQRLAANPPKGVKGDDLPKLQALVDQRKDDWAAGKEKARELIVETIRKTKSL